MTTNNNQEQKVQQSLWEALKLSGQARTDYLESSCGGDKELRREVESLLQAEGQAGTFLFARPAESCFGAPLAEKAGDRIGRYKLLEQIGEGGFGVVWMAEQEEPVRRRVALKIIKLGMDTKEVVARFEAERQALALMEHPNIARVFDGGATETGRPYFVMELVKGVPITDYSDANKLSTRERLELFIEVCRAVQHAHQKGVIHRDLKPTNILVTVKDDSPLPKVIDFGVAKATQARLTEKTVFTRFNQWIGTPAYMSPEQAGLGSLDVDTRSDIYSLGVLLYELLTGRTPFDTHELVEKGYEAVMRTIREEEPPKPSTRLNTLAREELSATAASRGAEPARLNRLVRGDLDWIVMKCLEKDRARRYETANDVALDVEHYLRHEPVSAVAPSPAYQAHKFIMRHRVGLAAATGMVLLLAMGVVVSTWQAVRAGRAEAREKLDRQRAEAEAVKSRQVAQFLEDMLQGVGPSVARGRDTAMMREILAQTAARVGRDLHAHPDVEADLRNTLGWVYADLGDDLAAETFHRDALSLRRKLYGNSHPDVSASLHGLGHALWRQGKLVEAESAQREGLAIKRKLLGDDHLDTARSLNDLALVLASQGQFGEAEAMLRVALATRKKLLPELDRDIANSLNVLAITLAAQGKLGEAETCHRQALAMRQQLFGTAHPDVAFSLAALGAVLAKEGKLLEAESSLQQSLAVQRELLPAGHPETLMSRCSLAKLLVTQDRLSEAARLLHLPASSEPAAIFERLARFLATSVHAMLRDGPAAVSFAERAVSASDRKSPACLDTLAASYAEIGEFAKAVAAQREAMALLPEGNLKEDCSCRLKLYESGRPYRDRSDGSKL